jgi:cytochrome P450
MQSILAPTTMPETAPLPPITQGWPLLGSLPALIRNPFAFLTQARERYGDIYTLNLGFIKIIVLNHPRQAQHLLRDHADKYGKGGALWDSMRGLVGNGLVVSEGAFWLRQRRLMQPHFHRQRLAGLATAMIEAIDESLALWNKAANRNAPFDLMPAFANLTMRVVVKALFGTALSSAELDKVGEQMAFALNYMPVNAATSKLPAWAPLPGRRRYHETIAEIDKVLYRIIAASRRDADPENHLLGMLLNSVDEETGEQMSDRQLRDEIFTLFLAGYETTSIALTWAFVYLTSHPAVMQKLQAEVEGVLAGRPPTFADLPKLIYTRQILQEVLRLRPPAYWGTRTAKAEDEIDGYRIPANTMMIWLSYLIHRHPEFWSNPEEFDPDRFASPAEGTTARHPFAWIPFGGGQHLCIGRDFALVEGTLALAMIAQRFQIRTAPGHRVREQLSTTLRPKGGVLVHLSPNRLSEGSDSYTSPFLPDHGG